MMASVLWEFALAAGGYYAVVGRDIRAQLSSLVIVDVLKCRKSPREMA